MVRQARVSLMVEVGMISILRKIDQCGPVVLITRECWVFYPYPSLWHLRRLGICVQSSLHLYKNEVNQHFECDAAIRFAESRLSQ